MSTYQVFGRSITGSFFIECLLREAGIDYEFVHVSRSQAKEAEFVGTNPLGRVPVLVTPDGRTIIETMAIFTHLVEAFPALAPPLGDPRRDSMWQHLAVMGTSLYPAFHRYHHTHYYGPEDAHGVIRDHAIGDAMRWLDYLAAQLAPFLAGDTPMAADFYFFMMTRWAPDREQMIKGRPQLAAFIDSMRFHPTVEAVTLAHGKPAGS
jgi:glutathione S-transferase